MLSAPNLSQPKAFLRMLFAAAVRAADPVTCLPPHLPSPPTGRTIVIGAGKASAAMAQALEDNWDGPLEGLVVTRYGHAVPCRSIEIVEAAHPVPDAAGENAAKRMLDLLRDLTEDDLVIALISGGGSALLSAPADGLTLADKQAINRALLTSGAPIGAMNCVRKHLSAVKGGRLGAAAWPAPVLTLAISDVPGDDPAAIASGPTVADPTSLADARNVLARFRIELPAAAEAWLARPQAETPKPGALRLSRSAFRLVAAPQRSLEEAAKIARDCGVTPLILGDDLEGEARQLGAEHGRLARIKLARGELERPFVLLSGGETTVTLRGDGRGGRNVEYLLGLAIALDSAEGIYALACDTDGIDGSEDNAGALCAPDTLARARNLGLDPHAALARNDAYGFFEALGDLVISGPTLTNVNDFRAILAL